MALAVIGSVVSSFLVPGGLVTRWLGLAAVTSDGREIGRGRSFDRIDIGVKPGHTVAESERELAGLLGSGFQIEPPSGRGQQFEAMLAAYSMMVGISSLFALFIGMFIIYNAFAIAVTERRGEIGIMRALGASQSQIRRVFLAESLVPRPGTLRKSSADTARST